MNTVCRSVGSPVRQSSATRKVEQPFELQYKARRPGNQEFLVLNTDVMFRVKQRVSKS